MKDYVEIKGKTSAKLELFKIAVIIMIYVKVLTTKYQSIEFLGFYHDFILIAGGIFILYVIFDSMYKSRSFKIDNKSITIRYFYTFKHIPYLKKVIPIEDIKTAFLFNVGELMVKDYPAYYDMDNYMYGVFLSTKEWDYEKIYRKKYGPKNFTRLERWYDKSAMTFFFGQKTSKEIPKTRIVVDGKVLLTILNQIGIQIEKQDRYIDSTYDNQLTQLRGLRKELGLEEGIELEAEEAFLKLVRAEDPNLHIIKCRYCKEEYLSNEAECPRCKINFLKALFVCYASEGYVLFMFFFPLLDIKCIYNFSDYLFGNEYLYLHNIIGTYTNPYPFKTTLFWVLKILVIVLPIILSTTKFIKDEEYFLFIYKLNFPVLFYYSLVYIYEASIVNLGTGYYMVSFNWKYLIAPAVMFAIYLLTLIIYKCFTTSKVYVEKDLLFKCLKNNQQE